MVKVTPLIIANHAVKLSLSFINFNNIQFDLNMVIIISKNFLVN